MSKLDAKCHFSQFQDSENGSEDDGLQDRKALVTLVVPVASWPTQDLANKSTLRCLADREATKGAKVQWSCIDLRIAVDAIWDPQYSHGRSRNGTLAARHNRKMSDCALARLPYLCLPFRYNNVCYCNPVIQPIEAKQSLRKGQGCSFATFTPRRMLQRRCLQRSSRGCWTWSRPFDRHHCKQCHQTSSNNDAFF